MDTTIDYALVKINGAPNKKHFRVRNFISLVNTEISGLRFTALKNKGTNIAFICGRKANQLEKMLGFALDGTLYAGDIVTSDVGFRR